MRSDLLFVSCVLLFSAVVAVMPHTVHATAASTQSRRRVRIPAGAVWQLQSSSSEMGVQSPQSQQPRRKQRQPHSQAAEGHLAGRLQQQSDQDDSSASAGGKRSRRERNTLKQLVKAVTMSSRNRRDQSEPSNNRRTEATTKQLQQLLQAGIEMATQQGRPVTLRIQTPARSMQAPADDLEAVPVAAELPPARPQTLHDAEDAGTDVLEEVEHMLSDEYSAVEGPFGKMRRPSACSHGQVTQIKCWLDSDGFVTGLAFESEAGIQSPAMCSASRGQLADGGVLSEGESIVDVVACRASAGGGVSWLEFHTNKAINGYPITCGLGASSSSVANSKPMLSAQRSAALGEQCKSLSCDQLFDTGRTNTDAPRARKAYPMGGLRASCNTQGQLSSFTNRCMDDRNISPGQEVAPISLEVQLSYNDAAACDTSFCQRDALPQQVVEGLDPVINRLVRQWGIQQDLSTQHAVAICKTSHVADREDALHKIQLSLAKNLCLERGSERSCQEMGLVALTLTEGQ